MPALHSDLVNMAEAIVQGRGLPHETPVHCPGYGVDVAWAVYRNNYFGNLCDTLAYAYPVIAQLVGEEFFRYLAKAYIQTYPSASGNLHHYGAELSGFLAGFEPAKGLVYLPDMAALEWACHCAYFADDAPRIDLARLAKIPPEHYPGLVLHTDPACHLVRSCYPVSAIWHAHQPETDCVFPVDLSDGPVNVLIHRRDGTVTVSTLSDAEANWLQNIQSRLSLGRATNATLEHHPDFDLDSVLPKWVGMEIVTDFTLGVSP